MKTSFSYDYSKLNGRMREKGLTQETLVDALHNKGVGMGVTSLNKSLTNKRRFKQDEICAICEILFIPMNEVDLYFFCHKSLEN